VGIATAVRAAGFALLGCLLLLVMLASSKASAAERYFIEFRARSGHYIGHTYIVYGRTDASGRMRDQRYAGLIPGADAMAGLIVPVAASVRGGRDDARQKPIAVYRRELSAAEYVRVSRAVGMLRHDEREWHLLFQNCNEFGIMVAESLGLRRPPPLMPPSMWVGLLRALNR
jgi:hypothetical protein